MKNYTKEQFWKLYEKLPQELRDALFSTETGDTIEETCRSNGAGKYLEEIVALTGQILVGLLLPQEFTTEVQKLGVKKEFAELIARRINRLVFYPVKPALEQLHRIEIEVSAKIVTPEPSEEPKEQELPEEPKGEDRYRESI